MPASQLLAYLVFALCLLLQTTGAAVAADAQISKGPTLRWAARGDVVSLDPYAFNEGMTQSIIGQIYEHLVERDEHMRFEARLAESWVVVNPTTWRFKLRRGVKFHDGSPLVAADVVFSIQRAQQSTSDMASVASRLGTPVALDAETVELRLQAPNPLLLDSQLSVVIMSRAWCVAHGVELVPEFKSKQEGYATRHAMGTGPYTLESFEPGVRTVLVRNPNWHGTFKGNVNRVVFMPIGNDATRTAALLSGEIDFTHNTPPQDLQRLEQDPAIRLYTGVENRLIFLGMDQARDQLLYASVTGRNPFKDPRVRQAFALAIDTRQIRQVTMRGQSLPTGCMAVAAMACLATDLEEVGPADLDRARKLMAEAGYEQGFTLTLDCPNDRYVNDQGICIALAGMLARIGVRIKVDARSKAVFFPKIERLDTSFYLMGWGGSVTDAQGILNPIVHSYDPVKGKGDTNYSRVLDAELDAVIDASGIEMDSSRRAELIATALRRVRERNYFLPLHRQTLIWASRRNVHPVIASDNAVRLHLVRVE